MGRGSAWLDTGSIQNLNETAQFISSIERRQGLKIGCLEEIAYRMEYIDAEQVKKLAQPLIKNDYGKYLLKMIKK